VAASEGNLEAVKYLLSKGALQTIEDARGNSALADALRESRTTIVEIFKS
jgi:ankyrin repeat protein